MNSAETGDGAFRPGAPVVHIREQQLLETIVRLQRGVLRLLFAFHGRSPDIDRRLKRLGNLVRSGQRSSEFNRLIDEAVNEIVPLAGTHQSNRIGDIIYRLLGRLEPTFGHQEDLRDLRGRAATLEDDGIDDFVRDCAEYLNRVAKGRPSDECAPDGGAKAVIQRLLDSLLVPNPLVPRLDALRQRFGQVSDHNEILEAVDQIAGLMAVVLDRTEGETSPDSPLPPFRDLVLEMVELLPVPDDGQGRTESIRRTLENASSLADLRVALVGIANLVVFIKSQLRSEIQQLAGFLDLVARRLDDIEVHLHVARALHDSSQTDCQSLNSVIEQQVSDIRNGFDDPIDLDALKAQVETRLTRINTSLSTYVAMEDKRYIEAKGTFDALTNEIRELESETQQLRTDLVQQHERAMIDPLTGIPNRLGYETRIESDFARWRRHGGSLSLALVDVDHFKHINDSYGHAAGDKVLATIAARLQEHLRASDHLSRFGGEEFLLILPETTINEAEVVVDKLRHMIEKCRFHFKKVPVPITVSCGVAEFQQHNTIQQVFDRADEAMFLAKRRGRNRCIGERELGGTVANG